MLSVRKTCITQSVENLFFFLSAHRRDICTQTGGFLIESVLEAIPQSILQMVFIVSQNSASPLNIASVLMSIISVASKSFLLSFSAHRPTFVLNICCITADIISAFATASWLAFRPPSAVGFSSLLSSLLSTSPLSRDPISSLWMTLATIFFFACLPTCLLAAIAFISNHIASAMTGRHSSCSTITKSAIESLCWAMLFAAVSPAVFLLLLAAKWSLIPLITTNSQLGDGSAGPALLKYLEFFEPKPSIAPNVGSYPPDFSRIFHQCFQRICKFAGQRIEPPTSKFFAPCRNLSCEEMKSLERHPLQRCQLDVAEAIAEFNYDIDDLETRITDGAQPWSESQDLRLRRLISHYQFIHFFAAEPIKQTKYWKWRDDEFPVSFTTNLRAILLLRLLDRFKVLDEPTLPNLHHSHDQVRLLQPGEVIENLNHWEDGVFDDAQMEPQVILQHRPTFRLRRARGVWPQQSVSPELEELWRQQHFHEDAYARECLDHQPLPYPDSFQPRLVLEWLERLRSDQRADTAGDALRRYSSQIDRLFDSPRFDDLEQCEQDSTFLDASFSELFSSISTIFTIPASIWSSAQQLQGPRRISGLLKATAWASALWLTLPLSLPFLALNLVHPLVTMGWWGAGFLSAHSATLQIVLSSMYPLLVLVILTLCRSSFLILKRLQPIQAVERPFCGPLISISHGLSQAIHTSLCAHARRVQLIREFFSQHPDHESIAITDHHHPLPNELIDLILSYLPPAWDWVDDNLTRRFANSLSILMLPAAVAEHLPQHVRFSALSNVKTYPNQTCALRHEIEPKSQFHPSILLHVAPVGYVRDDPPHIDIEPRVQIPPFPRSRRVLLQSIHIGAVLRLAHIGDIDAIILNSIGVLTSRRYLFGCVDTFRSHLRDTKMLIQLLTPIDEDEARNQIDEGCRILHCNEPQLWLQTVGPLKSARVTDQSSMLPSDRIVQLVICWLAQRWRHCNWHRFPQTERLRVAMCCEEIAVYNTPDQMWMSAQE